LPRILGYARRCHGRSEVVSHTSCVMRHPSPSPPTPLGRSPPGERGVGRNTQHVLHSTHYAIRMTHDASRVTHHTRAIRFHRYRSARTRHIIASATGTTRGQIDGSWRPSTRISRSFPWMSTVRCGWETEEVGFTA